MKYLLLLCLLGTLVACGQKGPLVRPGARPAPVPAAPADAGAKQ